VIEKKQIKQLYNTTQRKEKHRQTFVRSNKHQMSQNLQGQPRKLKQKVIAIVIFCEKYLRFICKYGAR